MTITDIIQQITECGAWVTAAFILTIVDLHRIYRRYCCRACKRVGSE
jgi:hypothetical protein